jgi:hypothetical protein
MLLFSHDIILENIEKNLPQLRIKHGSLLP